MKKMLIFTLFSVILISGCSQTTNHDTTLTEPMIQPTSSNIVILDDSKNTQNVTTQDLSEQATESVSIQPESEIPIQENFNSYIDGTDLIVNVPDDLYTGSYYCEDNGLELHYNYDKYGHITSDGFQPGQLDLLAFDGNYQYGDRNVTNPIFAYVSSDGKFITHESEFTIPYLQSNGQWFYRNINTEGNLDVNFSSAETFYATIINTTCLWDALDKVHSTIMGGYNISKNEWFIDPQNRYAYQLIEYYDPVTPTVLHQDINFVQYIEDLQDMYTVYLLTNYYTDYNFAIKSDKMPKIIINNIENLMLTPDQYTIVQ